MKPFSGCPNCGAPLDTGGRCSRSCLVAHKCLVLADVNLYPQVTGALLAEIKSEAMGALFNEKDKRYMFAVLTRIVDLASVVTCREDCTEYQRMKGMVPSRWPEHEQGPCAAPSTARQKLAPKVLDIRMQVEALPRYRVGYDVRDEQAKMLRHETGHYVDYRAVLALVPDDSLCNCTAPCVTNTSIPRPANCRKPLADPPTFAAVLAEFSPERQAELNEAMDEQREEMRRFLATEALVRALAAEYASDVKCEIHHCNIWLGDENDPDDDGAMCPMCKPAELTKYLTSPRASLPLGTETTEKT